MQAAPAPASVALESPDQPEVARLIAALDAYQRSLYPPESTHLLDLAALLQPRVRFVVARDADCLAVGCGAVVLHGDWGEVKRMFVDPVARGRKVASAILARLEVEALQAGIRLLRLETGPAQPEALALYAAHGWQRRGRYAGYRDDPLSVFMEKRLPA